MTNKRYHKTLLANLPEKFQDALKEAMAHPRGPSGVLEDAELKRGATIVPLGATEPFEFPKRDWLRGVISVKGDVVRIVAIEARTPRSGALKRLIRSIVAANLKPEIVAAMFDMPTILKVWGWQKVVENDPDWGSIDVWRPPA